MTITLTRDAWKKFAPGCPAAWTEALFANLDLLTEHGLLENELRFCHFAATVYAETGNFKELRENLSYRTTAALRKAWPSRFGHKSDAELKPLLRNPRGLAAAVYNGRMGNRPGSSDGYDFRGGGWIQTTGRAAVEAYCKQLGTEARSGTLDDPLTTLQFAVLEWTNVKCNQWADANDIRKVAKAINTGSADSNIQPNGMSNRIEAFARAWQYWGEYGVADKPVKKPGLAELTAKATLPASVAATSVSSLMSTPANAPEAASKLMPTISDLDKIVSTGQRVRGLTEQAGDLGSWLWHTSATPFALLALLAGLYFIWREVGIGTSRGGANAGSD